MLRIGVFIIILVLFIYQTNYAQREETDANVVGHVTCGGKHVAFASVFLKGTTIGTATDETGHYQLVNLPEGTWVIKAKCLGCKSEERTIIIQKKQTIEVKFELVKDVLGLEKVVVSASRTEINRKEAPVIISSISPKLFEVTQSATIADGIDFTPGIRMECNCQNCGFSQVRMNGLDGPYSQILINSRPVFSGLAGVYGLELIPTSMVERIEVVRGGGSALFGGNAIAGTINVITKEPSGNSYLVESNLGVIGIGNHEETDPALDRSLSLGSSIVTDDRKAGLFTYAYVRERDDFDENGDDYSEMVIMKNTTLGFNTFYKPGKKSKIGLDYYRINEFRRGGNKLDYLPHEADITEQLKHLINGVSLTYDLFTNGDYDKLSLYASMQTVERDSYYGAEQDPNAYGHTNDLTSSVGGTFSNKIDKLIFATSNIVVGFDNNYNNLKDVKLGAKGLENTTLTNQFVNTLGTFVQSDWNTSLAKISLGVRFDNYLIRDLGSHDGQKADDITGSVFAPRANVLFNLTDNLRYRISYAMGYRAPQLFDEDLHIEASGSRRILHSNADNLKQETSHSITTSINTDFRIGTTQNELLIEGFYTKLVDPFANEFNETVEEGVYEYVRVNAEDGAYVTGVNIEYNSVLSKALRLQLGFTLQKSEFETTQGWGEEDESVSKKFIRTPDQYGFLSFEWNTNKHIKLALTATYTGSMYVPHFGGGITSITDLTDMQSNITDIETNILNATNMNDLEALLAERSGLEALYNSAIGMNDAIANGDIIEGERLEKSEDFLHLGLRVSYDWRIGETNLNIYTGVQNIFNQTQKKHDRGLYRDAGYIYGPCKPRTIYFGLKFGNIF